MDSFFASDGITIRYRLVGDGPLVVLLHGAFIDAESNWSKLVSAGARRFRWLLLDLRGHGASDAPHDPTAYGSELYQDVIRLLDELGVEAAHLVGFSMGAVLGLKLTAEIPERLKQVVLAGAGWTPPEEYPDSEEFASNLDGAASVVEVLDPDGTAHPPVLWAALERQDVRAAAAMVRGDWRGVAVEESAIRELPVTLHLIVGAEDPALAQAQRLQKLAPRSHLKVLSGLAHGETPLAPEFVAAVIEALTETDRPPGLTGQD